MLLCRLQIRQALNQQTAVQFRQYAEQQCPGQPQQQDVLIQQLQEQHFQQYMQQVYQQQVLQQQQLHYSQQAHSALTNNTRTCRRRRHFLTACSSCLQSNVTLLRYDGNYNHARSLCLVEEQSQQSANNVTSSPNLPAFNMSQLTSQLPADSTKLVDGGDAMSNGVSTDGDADVPSESSISHCYTLCTCTCIPVSKCALLC